MSVTVTPSQLKVVLTAAIKARVNVLVTGAPGIGKTDIIQQAAKDADADLIVSHPAVEDPTDAKGLPWPGKDGKEATFLPFGNLARAIKAKKLTVWDLEDLGQANPSVQAGYMQLLKDSAGKLPAQHIVFIASTNRRTDRAGVTGILEPVKSRFGTILELVPDLNDYSTWALANGINFMQVAFLRYRPELLSKFQATADLTNSPMPRTWAAADRIEKLGLPQDVEAIAISGAVGEGAAGEYLAFRAMAATLPDLDGILRMPMKAAIPDEPNKLYATCMGLARRANAGNFGRLVQYAERMYSEAKRGEFAALLMRDVQRFDEDLSIQHTQAYVQMTLGPIGELLDGRNIK
jgi:hypothetical protein